MNLYYKQLEWIKINANKTVVIIIIIIIMYQYHYSLIMQFNDCGLTTTNCQLSICLRVRMKTYGSGVFQVRLDADIKECTECGGSFRLCLGHYQASVVSASPAAVTAVVGSSRISNSSQPVCSYGTLMTRIEASWRNYSNTVVEFPFAFSWPVSS